MENLKFHYDEEDKKFATLCGEKVELVRIVADRDIKNPFCDVKAGDLGGYIVRGTLCDEGESWVDQNSTVGSNCFVGGNGLVSNSILVHDVLVGGEGAIVDSQINPTRMTTVHAGGKIVKSKIKGNCFLSGEARIDTCDIKGGDLTMTDDAKLVFCVVKATSSEGLSMFGDLTLRAKTITGFGPINYSDKVEIEDEAKIRL